MVSLLVLALSLAFSPTVRAQAYPGSSGSWVASDAGGNPLQSGDRRLNSDGGAYLIPSGKKPTLRNTYPVLDSDPSWWFNAFAPNKYTNSGSSEYGPPGLSLSGDAGNTTTDNYGFGPIGYYDPSNYHGDRSDATPLPPNLLGSAHGDTSDTLTAYFVWTGTGPAPASAPFLVHNSVSASAYVGSGSGQTSGMSATSTVSLGDESVTATAGDAGSAGTQAMEGYHLVQASPSSGIAQVPMLGSVSVDSSNNLPYATWIPGDHDFYYIGPGNGYATASDSANASAVAYPVTLNLSGGIGPSTAKRLLIGQQLTATLSTGPLTPGSWDWTASGGNPFKNWVASNASAVYTPLSYEIGSSLVCYFAKPTTQGTPATVSCTAHLPVPPGAFPLAGLDVTATQTLTTDAPDYTEPIEFGKTTDLPGPTNPDGVQLQKFYYPSPVPEARGISWEKNTVTTPPQYVLAFWNTGTWNWTQLVTPGRQRKHNGVYEQWAQTSVTPPEIGKQGLDGGYPYSDWYWADGNPYGDADSPYEPLEGDSSIRAKDVLDSFADYLMYQPPGPGSIPVPLKKIGWYWEFHATKDTADFWNDSGQNGSWGPLEDFPAFPVWTFPIDAGQSKYIPPP